MRWRVSSTRSFPRAASGAARPNSGTGMRPSALLPPWPAGSASGNRRHAERRRDMSEAPSPRDPVNALSVDVEDYFQVSAFAPYIDRGSWDARPCRVERNVHRLLALFEARGARATFF